MPTYQRWRSCGNRSNSTFLSRLSRRASSLRISTNLECGCGVSCLVMKRLLPLLALVLVAASADASILRIRVNDMIHPISDEYIGRGLASAAQAKDAAVVIELTTPGGLIDS